MDPATQDTVAETLVILQIFYTHEKYSSASYAMLSYYYYVKKLSNL